MDELFDPVNPIWREGMADLNGDTFRELEQIVEGIFIKVPDEVKDRHSFSQGVEACKKRAIKVLKEHYGVR